MLVTALGYWFCGQISSLYAIPPGFASPIWPAAGFAMLAALVWGPVTVIGVFVASFLHNIYVAQSGLLPFSSAWLTSVLIASGASLQSSVAMVCVQRFTGFPALISRTKEALLLGLLAGPITCLISASVGVTVLAFAGVISLSSYLQHWLTWWVGDSIGAMMFAPILLVINIRRHRGKAAKAAGFLSLYFVLICIASSIFLYAKAKDRESTHNVFAERTQGYMTALKKQLDSAADNAHSVAAVFESFPSVDYDNFMIYSSRLYTHIPGTQALSWIPIVDHVDRADFEARLPALQGAKAYFFKKDSNKTTVPVEEKARYFPVYYIYPAKGNKAAIGFDLSSHEGRKFALEQAIASGQQVATEPIELVQEKGSQKAFLLFTPINAHSKTVGFVSMVYRIQDLAIAALGEKVLANYAVSISDHTGTKTMPFLGEELAASPWQFSYSFEFAMRHWHITFEPNASEIATQQSWGVWFILMFSFLFVILLGLLFLLILSRSAAIEHEVALKTQALSEALDDAQRSSQIKSAFLASMSHELRTPLNSIIGFSHRLVKTLQGTIDDRYINYIDAIHRNGQSLLLMINDILDLSKVEEGKLSVQKELLDVDSLVEEILLNLQSEAEEALVTLHREVSPIRQLPLDQKRFTQVLSHLVSNAIKSSNHGDVSIRFREKFIADKHGLEIEVHDTGVGVAEEDIPKLFRRYTQLGDTFQGGSMGTGFGLALVREIVEMHDGIVYVQSQLGQGSSFFAWFPKAHSSNCDEGCDS